MRFSQRLGYTPVKDVIQRGSLDPETRVRLWNVMHMSVLSRWEQKYRSSSPALNGFARALWHGYFKAATDKIPNKGDLIVGEIRSYFFGCQWYEVFDLIEFVVAYEKTAGRERGGLTQSFNLVLEAEVSAYRVVDGRVAEISSSEEIEEIEQALAGSGPLGGVHTHLKTALDMLASRSAPDYRNSVKESISAVEAMVNLVGGRKATLGSALKAVGVDAHPALKEAFTKLYGYTSDAQGIRHALMEEETLEFEDAKFMLVSCAAFVNYLIAKAGRAGHGL